jgi:hypothetical protein
VRKNESWDHNAALRSGDRGEDCVHCSCETTNHQSGERLCKHTVTATEEHDLIHPQLAFGFAGRHVGVGEIVLHKQQRNRTENTQESTREQNDQYAGRGRSVQVS